MKIKESVTEIETTTFLSHVFLKKHDNICVEAYEEQPEIPIHCVQAKKQTLRNT